MKLLRAAQEAAAHWDWVYTDQAWNSLSIFVFLASSHEIESCSDTCTRMTPSKHTIICRALRQAVLAGRLQLIIVPGGNVSSALKQVQQEVAWALSSRSGLACQAQTARAAARRRNAAPHKKRKASLPGHARPRRAL